MSVHSWGTGKSGELGTGNERLEALDPVVVDHFRGTRIRSVSCGEFHSLAVGDSGDLFVWGRGREGQLGNGEKRVKIELPERVWALRHERITLSACGYNHCLALTASGRLYQWGKIYKVQAQQEGQEYFGSVIGLSGLTSEEQEHATKEMIHRSHNQYYAAGVTGEEAEEMEQSKHMQNFANFMPFLITSPEIVSGLKGVRITEVAAGYSFSLAVTDTGRVYGWGFNDKFQLGLGHRYPQEHPVPINALKDVVIVSAACGQQHSVLLSNEGEIYTFGLGVFGQLGHSVVREERRPRLIESLSPRCNPAEGERMVQVACGSHHTIALSVSGVVWTWGSAEYGQQGGMNAYEDWATGVRGKSALLVCSVPRSLKGCFRGKHIAHIACGHLYNIAVTREGAVWTWGWGSYGVLGHGNHRFLLVPKQIRRLGGEPITQVSAGSKHTLAVNTSSSTTFAFDFKLAHNTTQFSDIVFYADGKRFYAHKAIVYSRCPYLQSYAVMSRRFQRPFTMSEDTTKSSTTEEKDKQQPDDIVVNVKHRVFAAVLFYLYTDHLQVASHLVEDVQRLAVQYRLPRLQALCKRYMLNEEEASTFVAAPSTFSDDLLPIIYEDIDDASDVTFIVSSEKLSAHGKEKEHAEKEIEEVRIPGHKVILSARSEYFRRIFNSGFRESSGNNADKTFIPITGMPRAVFLALLEFIYTGRITGRNKPLEGSLSQETSNEALGDIVVDLLLASDRFLLDELKQICEAAIEASLDIDNAAAIYALAESSSAPRLKRACNEFIVRTWAEVQKTSGFDELMISSPQLVEELQAAATAYEREEGVDDDSSSDSEKESEAPAMPALVSEADAQQELETARARAAHNQNRARGLLSALQTHYIE